MRPQGELAPERFAQWQDALDTLAKRKVTEAEGATVVNALKSWAELRTYMEQRDRLFPPDALDLYGFLQNGTAGPYRAYHSLKWFSKHGRLQWDFSDVPVPARKNPPKQARPEQAVAVEPPMVAALEEKIQSLYEAGDLRWRGLLSSWLVAFGVLRYQHIMRSRPVKVTPCSFHGYCPKGKQKANRGGFSFSIPATFINGWAWGSALFRDYSSLDKAKQATSGLCFDAEGTAYTLKYVNELNREVFEHLVQNTEDLSSYSWRRAAPTVGTLLKLSPLELCSLGDWADKSQIPKEATMPMHYSAARYEHSLRTKHLVRLAMEKLLTHESWETIPTETYAEALEYARQNVDKTLKQESRVNWAAPLTKNEMQARFQLSEALKLKAAAKREEAQAKGDLCLRCPHPWMERCWVHSWRMEHRSVEPIRRGPATWRRKTVLAVMPVLSWGNRDESAAEAIRPVNAMTRSSSRWKICLVKGLVLDLQRPSLLASPRRSDLLSQPPRLKRQRGAPGRQQGHHRRQRRQRRPKQPRFHRQRHCLH